GESVFVDGIHVSLSLCPDDSAAGAAPRRYPIRQPSLTLPHRKPLQTVTRPDLHSAQRLRGYLLLFCGMALVGVYVALSKPLTATFPVLLLAGLRFAIAAVAMLPWLRREPGTAPLDRRLLGTIFVQSLFGNFLFSILMLSGVAMTSAASAGLILATLPAAVALLSWIVLRERLEPRIWLAVALAVGGVAVLTLGRSGPGASAGSQAMVGNLLVLGCVFCEAVYVILGKRLRSEEHTS